MKNHYNPPSVSAVAHRWDLDARLSLHHDGRLLQVGTGSQSFLFVILYRYTIPAGTGYRYLSIDLC